MKPKQLILATLIATILSSISLYANAEQLTQEGFIKDFYTKSPQHNGDVKINLNLENQYSKRVTLDNYTVNFNETIALDNLKKAIMNNQKVQITYDNQTKNLINTKILGETSASQFNKRSTKFTSGILCKGTEISDYLFYCTFTDNNNIARKMVLQGSATGYSLGVDAFGGSISMDNLPKSDLTCTYQYWGAIVYNYFIIECPKEDISGKIDAPSLTAQVLALGKALIMTN